MAPQHGWRSSTATATTPLSMRLTEAVTKQGGGMLAYRVMPNHFHFVVWPRDDGGLVG
jgi:hypothetical protein